MAVKTKTAVVSKKVSDQQIKDAARWKAFIYASTLAYEYLSEEWLDFFSAQSDPTVAGTELVRLIDIAILKDETK
jgi:hypothetical protein